MNNQDEVYDEKHSRELSETKFSFQGQRVLLTYKTHLEKQTYIEWISEKLTKPISFIRLAHETGDLRVNYNHTHVVIEVRERFQTTNSRYFDYENIHPHIRVLKSKKALDCAKIYIAKEDPDNADLKPVLTPFSIKIDTIMNTQNPIDAIKKTATNFGDVLGILQLHNLNDGDFRSNKPDWDNFVPRPWQKVLYDLLVNNDSDGRSVMWIYDFLGGKGKTTLGDWLEDTQDNDFYYCDDLGNSRDAATIIADKLAGGWKGKGILIDLARSSETHTRMYNYLERIANGRITSQKYRGKTVKFDKPHVVVFANYVPQIKEMSQDRWKIFEIRNMELVRMSIKEVEDILTRNMEPEDSPYRFKNIPRIIVQKD